MGPLAGKTAVVTGASSGIGRAIALRMAVAGAHVFAVGRRQGALDETICAVTESGGVATPVSANVAEPGAIAGVVERAVADTERLDVMVNNAGVSHGGSIADGDPSLWREMLEVNVLALAVGAQVAVRAMRTCGAEGHIVNISSSASKLEAPGFYGATKTAVNAISASLRRELESDTIRVVNVIPGVTATNLARHHPELLQAVATAVGERIQPSSDGLFADVELKRVAAAAGPVIAQPDDVARAVLFAVTQPIELSISEIAVQPAKRRHA